MKTLLLGVSIGFSGEWIAHIFKIQMYFKMFYGHKF
jgi:hypothetical protein